MDRRVLLEVCVESVADALAATEGGADRLELNAALCLGGLTPSLGALIEVRQATTLPIIAMVRPRAGDFRYDDGDFRILLRDVEIALANGADGIAFGLLMSHGQIDIERCRAVTKQVGPATAVFHRAFDFTIDPFVALEQLIDLGVRRLMTSGQKPTATDGAPLIAELIRRAAGRIEILPAGGIRPWNVRDLIATTGCTQVHASLREPRKETETPGINLSPIPISQDLTSLAVVREMVNVLREGRSQPPGAVV